MDYDEREGEEDGEEEEEEDEEEDEEEEEEHRGILHQTGTTTSYDHQTPPPSRKEQNPSTGETLKTCSGGVVRYRECLKNHAVGIGGHAVDGCGEFMPAGEEGSLDALKCAACNCHRNFHRKEAASDASGGGGSIFGGFRSGPPTGGGDPSPPQFSIPYYRTAVGGGGSYGLHGPPPHIFHTRPPHPLALPSTSGGGGDDHDDPYSDHVMMMMSGSSGWIPGTGSSSKKRFRTKFTQEQKDRMLDFSERMGWRIQKHDEATVQQFCSEIGVKRQVLKVWMHNNKNTLGRIRDSTLPPPVALAATAPSLPPPTSAAAAATSAASPQTSEHEHHARNDPQQCMMLT